MPAEDAAKCAAAARERWRERKHGCSDLFLLREKAVHQAAPCLGVLVGVARYLRNGFFNVAMDADEATVREGVGRREFRVRSVRISREYPVPAGPARGSPVDSRWHGCPTKSPEGFPLRLPSCLQPRDTAPGQGLLDPPRQDNRRKSSHCVPRR